MKEKRMIKTYQIVKWTLFGIAAIAGIDSLYMAFYGPVGFLGNHLGDWASFIIMSIFAYGISKAEVRTVKIKEGEEENV